MLDYCYNFFFNFLYLIHRVVIRASPNSYSEEYNFLKAADIHLCNSTNIIWKKSFFCFVFSWVYSFGLYNFICILFAECWSRQPLGYWSYYNSLEATCIPDCNCTIYIRQNVFLLCCFHEDFDFVWIMFPMFLKYVVVRGTYLAVDDTVHASSKKVYIDAITQI